MIDSRASSNETPWLFAMVAATPVSPSQSGVETGPGLMVLKRRPRGPYSLDSDLERFHTAAFVAE